jgi:hypothetical protein
MLYTFIYTVHNLDYINVGPNLEFSFHCYLLTRSARKHSVSGTSVISEFDITDPHLLKRTLESGKQYVELQCLLCRRMKVAHHNVLLLSDSPVDMLNYVQFVTMCILPQISHIFSFVQTIMLLPNSIMIASTSNSNIINFHSQAG